MKENNHQSQNGHGFLPTMTRWTWQKTPPHGCLAPAIAFFVPQKPIFVSSRVSRVLWAWWLGNKTSAKNSSFKNCQNCSRGIICQLFWMHLSPKCSKKKFVHFARDSAGKRIGCVIVSLLASMKSKASDHIWTMKYFLGLRNKYLKVMGLTLQKIMQNASLSSQGQISFNAKRRKRWFSRLSFHLGSVAPAQWKATQQKRLENNGLSCQTLMKTADAWDSTFTLSN